MATNAEKALEIFKKNIGNEEGVGDWHRVTQEQINQFADATLDHQFIHVDPEKSAQLSPYKVTVAHGFLTLSMVVHLGASIPRVDPEAYQGVVMGVNYGLDKVRFPNPVKVDSKIRARRQLLAAELKNPTTIQIKQLVTVEIEGEEKPGCAAEQLSRLIYS
jgi:acyl dehydratase